jgi:saccharopine dehydrogenase-like NADP-dependent oxidoreductase
VVCIVKQILVIGAGRSSPYLIARLLEMSAEYDWFVTVGDVDQSLAEDRVREHPRGAAIHFDVNDEALRSTQIDNADVVINMLSPVYQDLVAWDCVNQGRHMLSVSYRDQALRDLDQDAKRKGLLILSELGLDPGLDHMSTMKLISEVRSKGGRIVSFESYGSGIPAVGESHNPFNYVITWNPRNVVMSSEHGAQYMEDGKIKIVPFHHVFHHTWPVEVDGVGTLEAYPNRDSMSYMETFGLPHVRTMIRGTLRYPGWSETWARVVQLGLPNEMLRIPDLAERTYREVVEMFLPDHTSEASIVQRVARFLGISPTGTIMNNLGWLGLFSKEPTGCQGGTAAEMMIDLLQRKLPLTPDRRDVVILQHELEVEYTDRPSERVVSTLVAEGESETMTAMAKTVGLPVVAATKLLLEGELSLTGSQIPTHESLYSPILVELEKTGIRFVEKIEPFRGTTPKETE